MMLLKFIMLTLLGLASASVKGNQQKYDQYRQREPHVQDPYASRLYQGTVKQVHVIFRHGDRAPIGTYPNDPNKNHDWPFGRAQLTDVGKRQHYELGNYLRNRYSHFLTTDPREVMARSSDKDRCLASVLTNLAAFYRPSGKWIWSKDHLPWQPVPVHTAPGESDWLLNEDSKCPAAEEIKKNIMKSPEGIQYAQKYQRLFEDVTEKSGKTVNDPSSVLSVYGITYINKLNNLTIPPWVDPIWDEFTEAADDAFTVGYSSKPFLRMRGGPLIGHIIKLMKDYDEQDHNTVQPKVYMYSTHDATIAAFTNAIGVFNGRQVPYAATVLLELHEHQRPVNKYTVRMYYRNTTESEPYPLIVPNCQQDCPLTDFEDLLKDMIPKDIRAECYGPQTSEHQRQELLPTSQCCCCNQCGGTSPSGNLGPFHERFQHGGNGPSGDSRAKIHELLMQMREVMEKNRQAVDRSIQELLQDMDELDRGLSDAQRHYRENSERLNQRQNHRG